jgi:dihydroxyacid dehydratase/phosphogluconate dehydratase
LLHLDVLTASGETLGTVLNWWEHSSRRQQVRQQLAKIDGVNPDLVIMDAASARREGLTSTVIFPAGNLAPEGAVIKATAIDPSVVGEGQVYRHKAQARVFTSERSAIQAVKGNTENPIKPGDIMVLIGSGPLGTGMIETAQITAALKYLDWGKEVALLTDGRFSGFSTGACIGHIGPEALAGGPIGKVRDGDMVEIILDRKSLEGSINMVGIGNKTLSSQEAEALLASRDMHPELKPHAHLPQDTRLWAALQAVSGGTWAGCIYDTDRIIEVLQAGLKALEAEKTMISD